MNLNKQTLLRGDTVVSLKLMEAADKLVKTCEEVQLELLKIEKKHLDSLTKK